MDPIDRLRALLNEFGGDPATAVIVQTDDGTEYSIVDVRFGVDAAVPTIVIEVTPT